MSSVAETESKLRGSRTSPMVAWGLLAGGVLLFVGGFMHPGEDPEGVTMKEHLHIMFEDPKCHRRVIRWTSTSPRCGRSW
jgi:hypothetical protein